MSKNLLKNFAAPSVFGPLAAGGSPDDAVSIKHLAVYFDLTPRTLHYYEEQGLLRPFKCKNRRYYNERQVSRLEVILQAKKIGLTIKDIYEVLTLIEGEIDKVKKISKLHAICMKQKSGLEIQKNETNKKISEVKAILLLLQTLTSSESLTGNNSG